MLSVLPNEIVFHIFSFLSPSDIIRRARRVSRRFYGLSKERSLWLEVLRHCDYVLPLHVPLASTGELEEKLLCGERVKKAWTAPRKVPPRRVLDFELGRGTHPMGMMGRYLVYRSHREPFDRVESPRYFWVDIEAKQLGRPSPVAQFDLHSEIEEYGVDSDFHQCRSFILSEENHALYVMFIQVDINTESGRTDLYLKLASIDFIPSGHLKHKIHFSHPIGDEGLPSPLSVGHFIGPVPGCDYVAMHPWADSTLPIHLFSISTGKVVICPRHTKFLEAPQEALTFDQVSCQLSPRYLVQVHNANHIEIFQLPTPQELDEAAGTISAEKVYNIILPQQLGMQPKCLPRPEILFFSETSVLVLLAHENVIQTFDLDLSTIPKTTQLAAKDFNCRFIPREKYTWDHNSLSISLPSSRSVLGVTICKRMGYDAEAPQVSVFGLWLGLWERVSMEKLGTELELPEWVGFGEFGFSLISPNDAARGRLAFTTAYQLQDGFLGPKVVVVDYV
ncbi:hypothetical protein NP233_g1101 [Leucocoprinus birnbaumii]|uniref:F-box domain-containing protein n=1 Tax=Leucocoprinus birnbaumii TaxID=56174 RepID=A0AAD5YY81_9AGAR|nr:hypothetical protein NP233_g1101 [Leucocoprinus birnbaumii]